MEDIGGGISEMRETGFRKERRHTSRPLDVRG